jgi:hypothetical protein
MHKTTVENGGGTTRYLRLELEEWFQSKLQDKQRWETWVGSSFVKAWGEGSTTDKTMKEGGTNFSPGDKREIKVCMNAVQT